MIRTCANPRCRRAWSELWDESDKPPQALCPTCRAGQKPLSRLRGEQKAKPSKD
jgi:hypothetical protein